MRIRVVARPRIHICLIDLAGISPRSFCGVGFSISDPLTSWRVEDSKRTNIRATSHLDPAARDDIERIVEHIRQQAGGGFTATLEKNPPQHAGFGAKTSLLLSLVAGIDKLKGLHLSTDDMRRISGRGGASGVGSNLFFSGGIVWDGGHSTDVGTPFRPSSASTNHAPPPALGRWPFPSQWAVGLILPESQSFSGADELSFFEEKTPIPSNQVLDTMCWVYHGVIPAFALCDIWLLKKALQTIHTIGLKREELLVQSIRTQDAFQELQKMPKIAVGLSSLGPLLYCIFDRQDPNAQDLIIRKSRELGAQYLGSFTGWNSGFEIQAP